MTTESHFRGRGIEIVVVIDKHTRRELDFDTDQVTGQEIKSRAGVPLADDLAIRHDDKLELVTNNEPITIFQHERFFVFPPGTIS